MFVSIAVIIVLIALISVLASTKPDIIRVHRVANIKAPSEKIFNLINDFHRWSAWSPYEKLDPAMKKTLSGAARGRGAVYEWEGKGKAGMGRMEITESLPASKITIQLDFIKPFEGHNVAEFTLKPSGDTTDVTWAMQGPAPFISKVMQVFFNLDRLIGKDFEVGLANLKTLAEAPHGFDGSNHLPGDAAFGQV
jgi:carbon monoxide dehydrogenase subunit G